MRKWIVALVAIPSLLFAACAPTAQQGRTASAPPAQGKPGPGAATTDAANTSASGPLADIVAGRRRKDA